MTKTALLIIDVQEAFNERMALGHQRNNPDAEQNIALLLAAFRVSGEAIFHIRHSSSNPESLFAPQKLGFAAQAFVAPRAGEAQLIKTVNSSFIGTSLEADLKVAKITRLVICGATTNHCVETTTRMAGNLGFDTILARDACWAFDQIGVDGEALSAAQVHQMSLANLSTEFATVLAVAEILSGIAQS